MAPKPVLPEMFLTVIEILKLPNFGLRDGLISLMVNKLAFGECPAQRLQCL